MGLDVIRVIVAGQLPREAQNAPLHLFSARSELLGFASGAYQRRSERTSRLLGQLFEGLQREGFAMPYTMEDFERNYVKEHFAKLTPEERRQALQALSPEERDQIRQYLDRLATGRSSRPRKPRRKR